MNHDVLVVEDDDLIASSLQRVLIGSGYVCRRSGTLRQARTELAQATPSLIVLDVGLPDGDGLAWCEELGRTHPSVPVVMLTSHTDEVDVVNGLNAGAVDYIAKPFRLAELLARIAAHIRYAEASRSPNSAPSTSARIVVGDLVVDASAFRAYIRGKVIDLRPREFELLLRLAQDVGHVVRREVLMNDVWSDNLWGPTKTLDVHINALRQKLDEPGNPSRIGTVRGVGYRLERP